MPTKLVDLVIDKVSLVDRGANQRTFAILKRADAPPAMPPVAPLAEEPGLVERLAKAIAGAIGVEKAEEPPTKTVDGVKYLKSDWAYTPSDNPGSWKLRLTKEPGTDPDAQMVGAAIAAIGKGYRGQKADIPADDLAGVKATLRAAWKKANPDKDAEEDMPDVIAKSMTFAERIAGQELQDALSEHFITLQDSLWSAIYAYDEDNQPLPMDQKQALVARNLDEFKAFLMGQMEAGVSKGDPGDDDLAVSWVEAAVRKVGKKISAARLTRLKEAADALRAVLSEVESEEDTEKRALPEEGVDMTSEELAAAIAKAQEPLLAEIAEIKKRLPAEEEPAEGQTPVAKMEASEDDEAPEWAIAIVERVEAIEKRVGRGQRTSANGEDAEVIEKAHWAKGIF